MSYVVLARKWRPQSFEDLVGQEHVSTTLANAIATGRVAHAFLFTGVRGVGKTTSARIMAKALNCEKGPTATPCQVCAQCREITAGSDVDVQEIDGASYNGVDEVRRLQETLPYRPQRDRFKIFIVDEVHMLSNAAWNAFLKTLEEPPPHVKFMFATTEVHKVPVTILSRCQRYDFKLIGAQVIAARLKHVLSAEGIAADDAAVGVLAREAAGSMRDAMSLMDQVIAWAGPGERLTADGVARVLGVAARSVLHRLGAALVSGDAADSVSIVGELAQQGYDLPHVARDLLGYLRDLVVAKVCADPAPLLDLADDEMRDVQALAARADADDLARLHLGFSKAFDDIARSGQPRASLEMALVRLARRPPLVPVDELLRRLGDLERRLDPGGGGPRGGAAPGGGGRPAPSPRGAPSGSAAPQLEPAPPRPAPPAVSAPVAVPAPAPVPASVSVSVSVSVPVPVPVPVPASVLASAPAPAVRAGGLHASHGVPPEVAAFMANGRPAVAPPRPNVPISSSDSPPPSSPPPRPDAASRPAARPGGPTGSAPAPSAPPAAIDAASLAAWRQVLELVRVKRAALASVLEHAAVLAFSHERVVLGYESGSFLAVHATERAAIELLEATVREHFGAATEVKVDTDVKRGAAASVAQIEAAARRVRMDAARRAVEEHPLVHAAKEVLGAELRDVRLGQEFADA